MIAASCQTTAYGYPFEVYHSSAFGQGLPPYWVRVKAGSMPGYFTILVFFPEVKTGISHFYVRAP